MLMQLFDELACPRRRRTCRFRCSTAPAGWSGAARNLQHGLRAAPQPAAPGASWRMLRELLRFNRLCHRASPSAAPRTPSCSSPSATSCDRQRLRRGLPRLVLPADDRLHLVAAPPTRCCAFPWPR
jgi:hypothetical protein